MPAPRNIGLLWMGQSNQQGATLTDNGGQGFKFTSEFMGVSEPFRPNSNGGGSCLPRLLDLGLRRGVRYLIFNGAIGGAAIQHFTGVVGATVTGGLASAPVANNNMSGVTLTAGTGVIATEGHPDFDPFGALARMRTLEQQYPQITEWIAAFANAESNQGTSSAFYQAAHVSIANYMFATGCAAYFAGLSSSGANTQGTMNNLQAGVAAAVAQLRAEGKAAYRGGDLYARFGMDHPTYPERTAPTTLVHLRPEGQRVQAELWDAAFAAAGY